MQKYKLQKIPTLVAHLHNFGSQISIFYTQLLICKFILTLYTNSWCSRANPLTLLWMITTQSYSKKTKCHCYGNKYDIWNHCEFLKFLWLILLKHLAALSDQIPVSEWTQFLCLCLICENEYFCHFNDTDSRNSGSIVTG